MTDNAKTVLITGTSSGVGLAAAIAAAKAGYTTVATLRNLDGAGPLKEAAAEAGVDLDIRRLDVTDSESVAEAVDGVLRTYGRLDAVVNNAGVGSVGTLELLAVEQIRAAVEVNFFGVLEVSRAALPHLRATGGRLITVGSAYGVVGQPFNEPYCAAKAAVEGYMESLAPVLAEVGVTVAVIEPGPISSSFVENIPVDRQAMLAGAGPYKPAFENYLVHIPKMIADEVQTPAEVAETVLFALTDPSPPLRLQTSEFSREFVAAKLADVDGTAIQSVTRQWLAPAETP
ncbi:SDR family oxidoreductase [Amycolatopsis sp.]|uniref:SDR family oxidoreductase n=1 Tax=Amycolatopsis sp. TaxID=37632 RepID=UPI002BFB9230|nr:SDR family oxidoreductase [Amycolatopsis sp.]HVV11352.1 SDR family oxidoreductase [Amycolatopsis sp.]